MYERWRFQRYLICLEILKIRISIDKIFGFVLNSLLTHHDAQRQPHDFLFPSFGFVVEFWVCFEHSTHITMLNAHPTIFCFRVLGLFLAFHTHTTMLNTHPTIFCFWVLGLFRTFHTHTPRCSMPTPRFSFSEFWVCCRVFVLFGLISPDVLRKN